MLLDCYHVNLLAGIALLIGVINRIEDISAHDVEDHIFKQNPSLSLEQGILLRAPREWLHDAKGTTPCAVCAPGDEQIAAQRQALKRVVR